MVCEEFRISIINFNPREKLLDGKEKEEKAVEWFLEGLVGRVLLELETRMGDCIEEGTWGTFEDVGVLVSAKLECE